MSRWTADDFIDLFCIIIIASIAMGAFCMLCTMLFSVLLRFRMCFH